MTNWEAYYDEWKLATPWDDEPEKTYCIRCGEYKCTDDLSEWLICSECDEEHG